jgi:type II secretory pathway pseudopilin PulG
MLLNSSLNLYKEWQNAGAGEDENSQTQPKLAGRTAAIALGLSALLLAKVAYNLYWFTVWDNTDDSLGYIWLIIPILAALFSSEILLITLPGRTKVASILYLVIIPGLMIFVSARAQRVDFRQLTEERAEQVSQALETYYSQEGRYPQDLQHLTPGYVLSLPVPVIISGQNWCYDGGDDYYRLGYVYREHWSDPRLIGQIYGTKGELPDLYRMCEGEVVALQERNPDSMYEYWMESE